MRKIRGSLPLLCFSLWENRSAYNTHAVWCISISLRPKIMGKTYVLHTFSTVRLRAVQNLCSFYAEYMQTFTAFRMSILHRSAVQEKSAHLIYIRHRSFCKQFCTYSTSLNIYMNAVMYVCAVNATIYMQNIRKRSNIN